MSRKKTSESTFGETAAWAEATTPDYLEPPPAAPPAVEARTPEHWAEMRGMLPQFFPAGVGAIAARPNPNYWKFAATKAFKNWQDDQQLTEAQFDQAVAEMLELRHGG